MKTRSVALTGAVLLTALFAAPQKDQPAEVLLKAAQHKELVEGDLKAAIAQYQKALARAGANRAVAAKALLGVGQCHEKLGQAEARKVYERLLREYADQAEAAQDARARLAALGRPAHPSAVTLRQVWTGSGSDELGGISPDGRYLSFTDWETGDLAVRDLATGQNRRLTRTGSWNEPQEYAYKSIVSPDGKRVAYLWHNKDSYHDLRLVGLDGSEPRVLVADKEWPWPEPFDWSPDGKEILALLSRTGHSRIVLVSAAQGSVRVLKEWPDSRWPQTMSFSPDGRYVVCDPYRHARPPGGDILLLSSAEGEEVPLIQHAADDWSPVWTPDGKKVLFASDRSGTLGLWAIGVNNGRAEGVPELLKPAIGRLVRLMGFTRQGSLFYAVESGMQDVYVAELDPATGKVLAQAAPVANRFAGTNMGPSWSPDGQYLAYSSYRGRLEFGRPGALTIVIKSVKTGEERDLSVKLTQSGPVRWFPDGKSFLARGRPPGFYRINVESGEVSLIKRLTGAASCCPELSRDGKALFYGQGEFWKFTRIMLYQMETGEEKELFRSVAPQSIGRWRLCPSPDGRQLAFVLRDPATSSAAVKIMPAGGGEPRELVGGPRYRDVELGGWSPDGRYLFMVTGVDGQPSQLWRVPAAGGEPQKLEVNMQRQWYPGSEGAHAPHFPAVHPDGRRIVFETGKRRNMEPEVWVMENLLPHPEGAGR